MYSDEINFKDRFVKIENGTYNVGSDRDVIDRLIKFIDETELKSGYIYNSFPEHSIEIKYFYISKYLTTLSEFEEFIQYTSYKTEAEVEGWGWIWESGWKKKSGVSWKEPFKSEADRIYTDNKDIMPVLSISWNDVQEYCKWFSGLKYAVRLPGEYEWEIFAGSINVMGMKDVNSKLDLKKNESSRKYINSVLKEIFEKNDFHFPGIIWEWTDDWFDFYPDGLPNKEFGKTYKVLKGGSLYSHPVQKTKEYRFRRCPTARSPFYGFRTIIELNE